ncbi:MAG TPA: FtsQ-type POTRA domain-containing protein [Gaiellaceae bacterium]
MLVGLALLVLAGVLYAAARTTSVFAVQTLEVRGGTPALRAQVRAALAAERGRSLLAVDGTTIGRRLDALPGVRSFTYDRAFPHTLRVVVRREVPALVVRRVPGSDGFLVAASGKVLRLLAHPHRSTLPRLWVKNTVPLVAGEPLPPALAPAAAALAAVRSAALPGGVRTVRVTGEELTLTLGGGLQVRLGDDGDLRLKLAIARRILRLTGAAATGGGYLDVSVPERPVLAVNPRVGG